MSVQDLLLYLNKLKTITMGRIKDIFMEIIENFEDNIPQDFDMEKYLNYRANGIEPDEAFLKLEFSDENSENNKQKKTHQN